MRSVKLAICGFMAALVVRQLGYKNKLKNTIPRLIKRLLQNLF